MTTEVKLQIDDNTQQLFTDIGNVEEKNEHERWIEEVIQFKPRRIGRILALQTIYEADFSQQQPANILARSPLYNAIKKEETKRASLIVSTVINTKKTLDAQIATVVKQRPIHRTPKIELNIIRLALVESQLFSTIPAGVIVNEAVELAKIFGGDEAPGFVNKILNLLLNGRK